jgi:N-acetylglutamate synthase-like GNAT family acetyltransferase
VTSCLELRRAAPADVPELTALAADAYAAYVPRMGRRPAPMTADYAASVGRGEVWVAACGGAIVGLIVLVPRADHLLLENVAVRPASQRTGIGGRLLEEAERHARRLGLAEIRLYTNTAMTENIGYYARRGYIQTHRAEQDGFQRVFFAKQLAAR